MASKEVFSNNEIQSTFIIEFGYCLRLKRDLVVLVLNDISFKGLVILL